MDEPSAPPPAPAAPTGRRERNKREKRERIVRAARDLFRDQGFDATTGREICERAGIATGTLFLYVRDKRELLFWIFRPLAERAFRGLPAGLAGDEGVVDGLMRVFGTFFRIYGRDPRLARVFVQELLFRDDRPADLRALSNELGSRVARIVEEGRARGELRADVEGEVLAQALLAHYVLWIQLWLGTGAVGRRAAERGLRRALELQLAGIGRVEGSKPRRRE
ncbi:MAG TPA: TetR/AcrR family transcriptional regulator [Myxococcota bacterium]|nr:TetR/AcrR family transcriptional regulator [Myxococcota bacterium]